MYDDAHAGCATLWSYRKKGTLPSFSEKKGKDPHQIQTKGVQSCPCVFTLRKRKRSTFFREIMNLFRIACSSIINRPFYKKICPDFFFVLSVGALLSDKSKKRQTCHSSLLVILFYLYFFSENICFFYHKRNFSISFLRYSKYLESLHLHHPNVQESRKNELWIFEDNEKLTRNNFACEFYCHIHNNYLKNLKIAQINRLYIFPFTIWWKIFNSTVFSHSIFMVNTIYYLFVKLLYGKIFLFRILWI